MNILHLKYAVEVAKAGSLSKAALYMNQPNLSRAIKELEASLGITIFGRSAKGVYVTPEGEEFLGYARKILSQIDEVEAIYKSGAPVRQRFSISVPRASYISAAFAQFSKRLGPERAEIFYKETNAMRVIRNILTADYKLGILRYASNYDKYFKEMLDEKGLTGELVTEFHYVLLMNEKHPLAGKETISFADLRPFIEIAHADPYVPSLPLSTVKKEELPDDIDRRIFVFERASQFELLAGNLSAYMWVSRAGGYPQALRPGAARLPRESKGVPRYADLSQGLQADRAGSGFYHRALQGKKAISQHLIAAFRAGFVII